MNTLGKNEKMSLESISRIDYISLLLSNKINKKKELINNAKNCKT